MELLMDRNVIRIHLKTAKENDRMDICSGYLKKVRNSAIIIDKLFETIYYFPESFSNHEVQSCMERNIHRTFLSLHKCICSLNQQNQNVVLVNTKCAYAMEETDCLVKILLNLSNKYKNVINIEYDAVKNCLQDKNTLDNGKEDVSVKHTDNFESMVDSGNTKCQNQEKKNTMQKRRKVLNPRSEIKDELDKKKYFPDLNKTIILSSIPIFRVRESMPAMLMALVNSSMDPYSLCEVNDSLGDIVSDDEGPATAVPQPQPSHQTNTRNVALPNTTVSNDNTTQGRRLEESSNSDSVPSSIHAHEQHGNQKNFIPNEVATDGTSVPAFTAVDRIRCPLYQAYPTRLSTFTKWPSDLTQKPEDVAQAGFYYTGLQDVVRCFECFGGLKNWDPEDDPWIEHARWFPLCPFVQKVKGQEFVELVRRMTEESDKEEDAVVHSTFQRNNPMAHPPDLQQLNLTNDTDSGNTKCQNQEKKNTMQKRRRVLQPRSEKKYELYFLKSIPIFRVHENNPAMLMALVNSNMDPYSLCEANDSLGDIVCDGEGPAFAVPQPQPSHQTNTRNVSLPNTTVSNDNPTQGRQLEESSNSESVPSSIHAHEQHGNQQNFIPNEVATDGTSVPAFTAEDRIRCPRYLDYRTRLSTFTKWPSDLTQKPDHVARAGFYYTGLQDVVRCFACDGGLKNWDPEDDPWIEHARWFPLCPFVQKVKGQEFVELVRRMTEESDEEEDAVVRSTFQRNNPMAHPPDLQQLNLTNDTDEPSQLDTDAAQSVLQTGYSKSTVAIAVEELISKDKREFTSQDIMEVILEKEDKGELLPKDGRSESPQILSQSFRSTQSTTEDKWRILRENEYLKSIVICMKCKVKSRNTLFLPCTHHCLCEDCADKCSLCPVCYKIVNKKIKSFMI